MNAGEAFTLQSKKLTAISMMHRGFNMTSFVMPELFTWLMVM